MAANMAVRSMYTSIESLIKLSKTKLEFLENLDLLSEKIRQIEVCTRGQCCNENGIYVGKVL